MQSGVLTSGAVMTLFPDGDRRVRRSTPAVAELFPPATRRCPPLHHRSRAEVRRCGLHPRDSKCVAYWRTSRGRDQQPCGPRLSPRRSARERRLAERVGFEPTVEFPLHTLSKRAPSTTRTSLRLESTVCEQSALDYRTRYRAERSSSITFRISSLRTSVARRRSNCVRPFNVVRSLTAPASSPNCVTRPAGENVVERTHGNAMRLTARSSCSSRGRRNGGSAEGRPILDRRL